MLISKNFIGRASWSKRLFVEHMELDMCVKFQVSQTYGVRGVAFPKTHFK